MPGHSPRGFSLVEALVASLLVAVAAIGLAQLITAGAAQAFRARRSATALTLAQAKLEALRALEWRFAADGARAGSAELASSPPASLLQDAAGYVEALDRFGEPVALDGAFHYRRRWAIAPHDASDVDTLRLEVCVFTSVGLPAGDRADACVWTIRTRQP